jgi:hypothetical protein
MTTTAGQSVEIRSPEEREIWARFAAAALQPAIESSYPTASQAAEWADELLLELRKRNPKDPVHEIKIFVPTGPDGTPTGLRYWGP